MRSTPKIVKLALPLMLLVILAVPGAATADDGEDRFGLGLGFGLVEPEGTTEPYLTASLRIRLGDDDGRRRSGAILAYIEPEIGYWESDSGGVDRTDTLLGVNIVGVAPAKAADFYVGAGLGLHSIDDQARPGVDSQLGANLHVGVELHLSDNLGLFGTGRVDLVEEAADEVQSKVYLGLRFKF